MQLRLGLARMGTFILSVLFWTWLAVKGVVTLIGATTVVDDYNQMIERLPKFAAWLFSTSWWVPAGLASALSLFLIWLSWPSPTSVREAPQSPYPPQPQPLPPMGKSQAPYLKSLSIHPSNKGPLFVGIVSRVGRHAKVFVEFELLNQATKEFGQRFRVPLTEIDDFEPGLWGIKAPIITEQQEPDGTSKWYWGEPTRLKPEDQRPFSNGAMCRGRVAFVGPEGLEESCFFHSPVPNYSGPGTPQLLNESMFDFAKDWQQQRGKHQLASVV
jgi:hypothetical protein